MRASFFTFIFGDGNTKLTEVHQDLMELQSDNNQRVVLYIYFYRVACADS